MSAPYNVTKNYNVILPPIYNNPKNIMRRDIKSVTMWGLHNYFDGMRMYHKDCRHLTIWQIIIMSHYHLHWWCTIPGYVTHASHARHPCDTLRNLRHENTGSQHSLSSYIHKSVDRTICIASTIPQKHLI